MAHASGPAEGNFLAGDFVYGKSRVHYRTYTEAGQAWLSFDREGASGVNGKRELLYYIGSGGRGTTYLFALNGFLFESPVNWYSSKQTWDMAPGFQNAREIPMNLPASTSCLNCHVSGMRPPIEGTENRYEMPVFSHTGITCKRCHGPGDAHVHGGPIVNPAKLSPERRDAVCMQCHMEGSAAIERPGRHIYEFRPGDSLSDYIRFYVLADASSSPLGAVSQVQALAQSTCKKKSGDVMSCISCHDPHYSPPASERVSYYRGKCMACHSTEIGVKHHPEQRDCSTCHMPASPSTDVPHTEVTDHRIPRRPTLSPQLLQKANATTSFPRLVPFPESREADEDIRDMALAWESLADGGMQAARPQAERTLRQAAARFPNDPKILSALGYVEQERGAIDHAKDLYQRALTLDPTLIDAATNLGAIDARSGQLRAAVTLWQSAFDRAPGRSAIGMNIARVYCAAGKLDQARSYVLRVLEFNPDMSTAKNMLHDLDRPAPRCRFN
jgi:Tfp pilus assembly protein PilF